MSTDWHNPQQIIQYAEDGAENIHIRWDDSSHFSGLRSGNRHRISIVKELVHISRSPKPDFTNKTYYLKLTNFQFVNVPISVSGIECKLESKRYGRVTDDTINLLYDNQILGDNQAKLDIDTTTYYGGKDIIWGAQVITKEMIIHPSFGLLIRFKSHPSWPHSDPIELVSIQLRIH